MGLDGNFNDHGLCCCGVKFFKMEFLVTKFLMLWSTVFIFKQFFILLSYKLPISCGGRKKKWSVGKVDASPSWMLSVIFIQCCKPFGLKCHQFSLW